MATTEPYKVGRSGGKRKISAIRKNDFLRILAHAVPSLLCMSTNIKVPSHTKQKRAQCKIHFWFPAECL